MDGYRTEGDRWAVVDGPVAGGAWAVAVAVGGRAAAVEARADGAAGGARASRVHAALRLLDALHAAGARRGDAVALAGAGAAEYAPAARAVAASTGVQLLDPDAFAARAPAWAAWVAAETDGLGVRAVLELPGFRDAGADASDADADAARLALLADAAAVLAPHGRVLLAAPCDVPRPVADALAARSAGVLFLDAAVWLRAPDRLGRFLALLAAAVAVADAAPFDPPRSLPAAAMPADALRALHRIDVDP